MVPHPFGGFKTCSIALTLTQMMQTTNNDGRVADAVREHWADRLLPRAVRPYARLARLERPIGWWLLLLPGWWAIAMAQTASGGGMANLWGVLILSTVLTFLSLRGYFGTLDHAVFGMILIVIISLAPQGPLKPIGNWLRRFVPGRRRLEASHGNA